MEDDYNYDFGYGGIGDVSTGDTSGYNYDFGYGGTGDVSVGDTGTPGTYNPTTVTSTGASSGSNILERFLSGNLSGNDKALATLGFGIASLASALRNKPPEVKMPVYKEAPVYNRALTAPMLPPQPAPQTSPSGQNIYQPMRGLPLFFNPNPFQFNPTEAAKRYGPTPEEISQGWTGYQQGLEGLYKSLGPQPAVEMKASGGQIQDGRYLRGDGDGMSDSIHAFIEGGPTGEGEPARLARNEFVIPADVVADLGNGSSDAGAEALYEMMDRIRMARHDTKEQPPAVDVDKILPA